MKPSPFDQDAIKQKYRQQQADTSLVSLDYQALYEFFQTPFDHKQSK